MKHLSTSSRRQCSIASKGYTFVELLVVTALVGILVALLLPAVQAAREAARRIRCSKHLEQLVTAIHCYEMQYRLFPPGTIDESGPIRSQASGYHHNWIIQLLPFIEEKNTYKHIDKRISVYDPRHYPVRRLRLQYLHCYSSPNSGRAYSDYAAVHHDVEAPIDTTNNGSFYLNSRISYFDIKDGSSNTLFVGEKRTPAGDLGWASGTRSTLRNTGVVINAKARIPPPTGLPSDIGDDNTSEQQSDISDSDLHEVLYGSDGLLIQRMSDDGPKANDVGEMLGESGPFGLMPAPLPTDPKLAVGGFGSFHPGGAQFAMGDGSVRYLSQTMNLQTYLSLGNRDDGELMNGDW